MHSYCCQRVEYFRDSFWRISEHPMNLLHSWNCLLAAASKGRSHVTNDTQIGHTGIYMIIFALMTRAVCLCRADLKCDHDQIASVQYTESATALAYEETQSNNQGAVYSQVSDV